MTAPKPDVPSDSVKQTAKEPPLGSSLVPMNLEVDDERAILLIQREICTWGTDRIPHWREAQAKGDVTGFWIVLPFDSATFTKDEQLRVTRGLSTIKRDDQILYTVGHVSLDKRIPAGGPQNTVDPTLANSDGSVLHISSLFVLPEFSSSGLGALAMRQCEKLAQEEPYGSPNCHTVSITTLSPRHCPGEQSMAGIDGIGIWDLLGVTQPKMDNSVWYRRLGYVSYKNDEPRYHFVLPDGSPYWFYAAFMHKRLR